MKEKVKNKAISGFAKIISWAIFLVCSVFMIFGNNERRKRKLEKKNKNNKNIKVKKLA